MNTSERIAQVSHRLFFGKARDPLTGSRAGITSALNDPIEIHRGVYIQREDWQQLTTEDQHLAQVVASRHFCGDHIVYSHESAAALHGLPIFPGATPVAHLTRDRSGGGKKARGIVRHRTALAAEYIVMVAGIRCTSIDRTLLDLCRSGRRETALASVDAFLRREFTVGRLIDHQRIAMWRASIDSQLAEHVGGRGVGITRELLALADPRKESPLESVSHLRLAQLGFEVELQVAVPGPNGRDYYVDFEFVGRRLFGECDGASKYLDPRLLNGLTAEQAVYREKRRQNWICSQEKKEMIRWGSPEVRTLDSFARMLVAFGVQIPRPPRP